MTPFIIAIDGTAASGKGTLARKLAERLGLACLDTGKLYRYVGYSILQSGGDPADPVTAIAFAEHLKGKLSPDALADNALQGNDAGQAASKVAAIPGVRTALLDFQRDFAQNPPTLANGLPARGAILDGRDIGTVICPAAPVKLFVTASLEIRADRRTKELQSKGIPVTYEAVLADMQERDARDSGRATAPMKVADDAILVDTGRMTIEDVLETALSIIMNRTGMNIR